MNDKKNKDSADFEIKDYHTVKVTEMGHLVEIQYMEKQNNSISIKKLNADEYVNLVDGEILKFNKSKNKAENENSLRKTFKRLRNLINNNFVGSKNELFVTLTYKNNMTCNKQLYVDFDKFMKRLRYKYKDISKIEYISVIEPQARGAWHSHLLLRFEDLDKVFIDNSDFADLWGHGFVRVNRVENVDNIGAYLSSYLTDLEVNEENVCNTDLIRETVGSSKEIKVLNDGKDSKSYVKGGRLHLYPPEMNLYRSSRGIKQPESFKMLFQDVKKNILGSAKPCYSKTYNIKKDDFENTISFLQYNLKR